MIKAILFDLDGVYFDRGTSEFVEEVSDKFNLDLKKVKEAFSCEIMKQHKRGEIDADKYWAWFIQELDIKTNKDELLTLLRKNYSVDQKIKQLVAEVKKLGYRTIICSNNYPERIDFLQEDYQVLDDFDHIYLSYEQGAMKPRLVDIMLEGLSVDLKPDEILLIDDEDFNFVGLDEKGIKYIHYKDYDSLIEGLKDLGILS